MQKENTTKKRFPINIVIQVPWIDIDIYGRVNESNYFRYFDATRIKYFEEIGFYEHYHSSGLAGVVSRVSCNYLIPVTYPDKLQLGAKVLEINKKFIQMEHSVTNSNNELAVLGESEIVIFDHKNARKADVPEFLIQSIEQFENRKFIQ